MSVTEGLRFSQNYIARGEPTSDSERMRLRIARLFALCRGNSRFDAETLELALGVAVPWGPAGRNWDRFFLQSSLRDLLDSITVFARALRAEGSYKLNDWLNGIAAIFADENVRYRIDSMGGVHFAIDAEFEHNQACAIAALQAPRYAAARAHFEAAQRAQDTTPPQTREAIRQTFECVETVFKLMFPDVSQLGASEVAKKLKPIIEGRPQGSERNALGRWVEGFVDWVNGAHQYRHGQGVEVPDNPSLETTVLSVSLGAAYARWLAELDSSMSGN